MKFLKTIEGEVIGRAQQFEPECPTSVLLKYQRELPQYYYSSGIYNVMFDQVGYSHKHRVFLGFYVQQIYNGRTFVGTEKYVWLYYRGKKFELSQMCIPGVGRRRYVKP